MTHTWTILRENIISEFNQRNQVIKTIWFELLTQNESSIVKVHGRINFDLIDLNTFIEYNNVTDDVRINWIKDKYGDDYENYNISQLSSNN